MVHLIKLSKYIQYAGALGWWFCHLNLMDSWLRRLYYPVSLKPTDQNPKKQNATFIYRTRSLSSLKHFSDDYIKWLLITNQFDKINDPASTFILRWKPHSQRCMPRSGGKRELLVNIGIHTCMGQMDLLSWNFLMALILFWSGWDDISHAHLLQLFMVSSW